MLKTRSIGKKGRRKERRSLLKKREKKGEKSIRSKSFTFFGGGKGGVVSIGEKRKGASAVRREFPIQKAYLILRGKNTW